MNDTSVVKYWPRRYTVLGLSFCATFICFIDRINISVAIIPMAEDYAWTPSTQGLVLSSFYIGYMLTQIGGGLLADRFGGKIVLGIGVLLWSLFTLLTPLAASTGFALLIACRIAMGMGEGVTFPSVYSLTTRWMLPNEHAKAVGFNQSGIPFGTVFALLVTPIISVNWGWEWSFYSFGAVGVVWFAVWHWKTSATPAEHPTISADELSLINEHNATRLESSEQVPLRRPRFSWTHILGEYDVSGGRYEQEESKQGGLAVAHAGSPKGDRRARRRRRVGAGAALDGGSQA